MSYPELFLLAVGLSFDTFAVSFCGGMNLKVKSAGFGGRVKIFSCFAFFQAGFTLIGWLLGITVSHYIQSFDHWVAAVLLWYIGGKMILESLKKKTCDTSVNLTENKYLVASSVATSIDALAVGISFAMVGLSGVRFTAGLLVIGLVTALASLLGLSGGDKLGSCLGRRSELLGGLILIAIGIKILIEHLIV